MGVVEAEKAGLDHAQPSGGSTVRTRHSVSRLGFWDLGYEIWDMRFGIRAEVGLVGLVGLVGRDSKNASVMCRGLTRRTLWPSPVKKLEIFRPSKP